MDVQPQQLSYDDLEIVGSTIVPEADDLPRRLSPIFRNRRSGDLLLPLEEELELAPRMSIEDPASIGDLVERGEALMFPAAMQARPRHWLVQFEAGTAPEYLLDTEAHAKLRLAARLALERAAGAVSRAERSAAVQHLWYARRADPNDPLPLLVLIVLLRPELPAEEVAVLERDLDELHAADTLRMASQRLRSEAALSPLARVIESASAVRAPKLAYLAPFRSRRNFLAHTRAWYNDRELR